MKFTTSTALFALSTAVMVAAAPLDKRAAATSSASLSDFNQVVGDTADSDLFAALLDPTFVDADGNVEVGDPVSSSQASSSSKPFTLHFGVQAQSSTAKQVPTPVAAANVGAAKPAGNYGYTSTVVVPSSKMVVVTIPGQTRTSTSYYYYRPTAAAKPSSQQPVAPAAKPTSAQAVAPAAKPTSAAQAAKPTNNAAPINAANVGAPVKAPIQPSPAATYKPVTSAAPINAANVGAPKAAGGYTVTATVPSSKWTTVTIPGRTSTIVQVTHLPPGVKGFTSYITAKPTQH